MQSIQTSHVVCLLRKGMAESVATLASLDQKDSKQTAKLLLN